MAQRALASRRHAGTAGQKEQALDAYIKSYKGEPETSAVRRSVIEQLYKHVNGSLDGLDEKLGTELTVARASALQHLLQLRRNQQQHLPRNQPPRPNLLRQRHRSQNR